MTKSTTCDTCKSTGEKIYVWADGGAASYQTVIDSMWGVMPEFCDCEIGRGKLEEFEGDPPEANLKHYREQVSSILSVLYKNSGMSDKFRAARLQDFMRKIPIESDGDGVESFKHESTPLYQDMLEYADRFHEKRQKNGLFIAGPVGTGKTHAASAIVNKIVYKYRIKPVIVNLARASVEMKNSSFNSDIFTKMENAELLFIDDMGTEMSEDWLNTQVYLLIDYRYQNQLPTIITSNQSLDFISENLYTKRVGSRLSEMCSTIMLSGEDRRMRN